MQFTIPADDLSTDLSESYLALRMYVTHATTGAQYTKGDLEELAAFNTYVSFGQNGVSYSPACLVKLCRLFNGNMQLLEETNFSNVLTETLAQIMGDFESVASSSLTSNSSVVFGAPQSLGSFFANLLPDTIGTGAQLPIEVHVPLKKLFGFFKNKNVYLNDPALAGSGGNALHIWLELEDRKPLLQAITCVDYMPCPLSSTITAGGLQYTLATNPYCSLTTQNDVGQMTRDSAMIPKPLVPSNGSKDDNDNQLIMTPSSFIVQSGQIVSFFNTASPVTATSTLEIAGLWTTENALLMGLVNNNYLKLNFRLSAIGGLVNQRQDQIVSRFTQIYNVNIGETYITITTSESFVKCPSYTQWTTTLDTVEVIDLVHCVPLFPQTATGGFQPLIQGNIVTVNTATIELLQNAGFLTSDALPQPTNAPFVLNCQTYGDISGVAVPIEPCFDQFFNPDVPSGRKIVSNNAQKLPIQGSSCKLVKIAQNGGDWDLTFNNLGMFNNNSLQPAFLKSEVPYYDETTTGTPPTAVSCNYHFFVTGINASGAGIPVDDFSYQIDKAELVLVQQAKDKTIPMSRIYSTWRVEVATIETALPIYQRQFLVTEPNCYSILLCMPQYSTGTTPLAPSTTAYEPQSLISFNRGVQSYRWSINNIDDTNRDLEVATNSSYYPSSLHLEKLMDALANDGGKVKSLSGLLTVPHSVHPVVALPLKIYDVKEGMNYVLKPEGYQAQITLYGDVNHNVPVTPGPIFLFKHCLKMLPA
ncbi:MAG: hypothetical protein WCI60_01655 [bacterium]